MKNLSNIMKKTMNSRDFENKLINVNDYEYFNNPEVYQGKIYGIETALYTKAYEIMKAFVGVDDTKWNWKVFVITNFIGEKNKSI